VGRIAVAELIVVNDGASRPGEVGHGEEVTTTVGNPGSRQIIPSGGGIETEA
jgi:hypothetical protein